VKNVPSSAQNNAVAADFNAQLKVSVLRSGGDGASKLLNR
jgi:hypothetical protein